MHVKAEDWPSPDRRIIRAAKLTGIGLVDRAAYGEATAAIAKRAMDRCTAADEALAASPSKRNPALVRATISIVGDGPLAGISISRRRRRAG